MTICLAQHLHNPCRGSSNLVTSPSVPMARANSQPTLSSTGTICPNKPMRSLAVTRPVSSLLTGGVAMTKLRALLAGAVIAALGLISGLYAQQLISFTLTGNEVIVAATGGPGGPSIFIPVGELRNATGLKTFSGSGA